MLNSTSKISPTTTDLSSSSNYHHHGSTPGFFSTHFKQSSIISTMGLENATLFSSSSSTYSVQQYPSTTTILIQEALNSTFSKLFEAPSSTVEPTYSAIMNNTNNFATIISPTTTSTMATTSFREILNSTVTTIVETAVITRSTIETTFSTIKSTPQIFTNSSFVKGEESLTPLDMFTAVMLLLLFFIGTIGNVLTIWVFMIKKKRKRKRFELLLSVLAITDLFSAIFVPLLFLYGTLTKYNRWDMGYLGCKLISSLFPVSVSLSQGILILISYDRYRSMSNPFGSPIRGTFIIVWIATSFVISCALVSPYYYALELVSSPAYGINTCAPSPYKFNQYYIYSCGNILRDVIATVALIVLGIMTNKSLKSKQGTLFSSLSAFNKRQRNANKARKMLIVVACVFSVCVIPLDLFQVLVYTMIKLRVNISSVTYDGILKVNTFLLILQVANSSTNFIIYSKMNRNFMPQFFACIQRSKHFTSSFRTTFRSTRSGSLDSLADTAAVILSVLPITPDSVFLPPSGTDTSGEEAFHFPEPNNNF